MSKLVDRFQEPMFIISVVVAVALGLVFYIPLGVGWFVSALMGLLLGGGLYVLYNDYMEKKKQEDAETAKQEDLQRRIKEQAKTEMEVGKCISCTAELPEGAEECPKCGYAVEHYKSAEP